jgi:xylose isomerase
LPEVQEPLSFKHYNDRGDYEDHASICGSQAYWHSFRNMTADPFGVGTRQMPWTMAPPVENAQNRPRV